MFIYPIYNHNWRNIGTIYLYNKTSIKRNILTIKKIRRKVGRAKNLSTPLYDARSTLQTVGQIRLWSVSVQ